MHLVFKIEITSEYMWPAILLGSTIAAKEDVMTTRVTVGAFFLIALRIPVVLVVANAVSRLSRSSDTKYQPGSRKFFWISVRVNWYGMTVWITASKGGLEITACSKAMKKSDRISQSGLLTNHPAEQCLRQSQSQVFPLEYLDVPLWFSGHYPVT